SACRPCCAPWASARSRTFWPRKATCASPAISAASRMNSTRSPARGCSPRPSPCPNSILPRCPDRRCPSAAPCLPCGWQAARILPSVDATIDGLGGGRHTAAMRYQTFAQWRLGMPKRGRGAALLEFALAAPPLLLLGVLAAEAVHWHLARQLA